MIIRPEEIEDFEGIAEVNRLAFSRNNEAMLVERLRDAPEYHPGLSLVAVQDTMIVGHILFTLVTIETESVRLPALALAPLAVRPEKQLQGVGTALIEQGLKVCHKLGHRIVIVLGHADYYPRFGFQLASRFGIKAPFPVPEDAFMVVGLRPGSLKDVQGTVIYPSAFNEV